MKTKHLLQIIMVAILLSFYSCRDKTHFLRSFIYTYSVYDSLLLQHTSADSIAIMLVHYDNIYASWDCDYSKTYNFCIKYDSLCHVHNDLTFNKTIYYNPSVGPWDLSYETNNTGFQCWEHDVRSIEVVSDADFDEQHRAGQSLNDIIRFISTSPKKFIDSGYKDMFDWENNPQNTYVGMIGKPQRNCYHPIDKLLSQMGVDEMIMLPDYIIGYFIFEKAPTLASDHHLTATFNLCNGQTIVAEIDETFGKTVQNK